MARQRLLHWGAGKLECLSNITAQLGFPEELSLTRCLDGEDETVQQDFHLVCRHVPKNASPKFNSAPGKKHPIPKGKDR